MKVTPSNQTLILASERGASEGFPSSALRGVRGDTTLKRVTILASRPDDTLVYLQADYSSTTESAARALPPPSSASHALTTVSALPTRVSRVPTRGNSYTSSRGIELYSSTQRMLTEAPFTHIDVLA